MIMALYNLQDVLLNFLLIFHTKMRPKYKKLFCCPALQLFNCLPPLFCCLPLWKIVRLPEKNYRMQQIPLAIFGNWVCTYLRSSMQLLSEFSVLLPRLSIFMALLSSKSIRCNKFKSHLSYHFKGLNLNKIRQRELN